MLWGEVFLGELLYEMVFKFLIRDFQKVVKKVVFLEFCFDVLIKILFLDFFKIDKEIEVFDVVYVWIKYDILKWE